MRDELNGMDLNLLLALDALISERSVTRAGERTGVGQSAMSSSLARLRRQFGDDLLVRAQDGMRLTPRAIALREPLRTVLRLIRTMTSQGTAFDPATAEKLFTIAIPDGGEVLLIPDLLAHCRAEAPGIRIVVRTFERADYAGDLDADRLDLAIGFAMASVSHHKQRLLYRDHYVVLYNDALLNLGDAVSLADYARLPHVTTSYAGTAGSAVDDALAAVGLSRVVMSRTPRFLMVPHIVRAAPVLATMGEKLAGLFAHPAGLRVSRMPLDVPPFSTNMVWHESYDEEPAHIWLRKTLVRIAGTLG